MALVNSTNTVTNGLIFYYDILNNKKSWKGQPTTNLVGDSMSIYNNVPSDVTATLTTTGDYYNNAPIYKLTLTPTTASGVSYLTAGNNPGIGVVSGGGGGTANRYTGHAIFYRSTVPLHTTPLFTNYSNIGGWGAGSLGSNRSVNMNDGWFRGEVIWYDTVTRSDGKYWAINPATATLNIPIIIYWAAPFKEDRNDSAFISPYVPSSRASTQVIIDLTNNGTATATALTYASDGTFSFDGSSSYITASFTGHQVPAGTIMAWVYPTSNSGDLYVMGVGGTTTYGASRAIRINSGWCAVGYGSSTEDYNSFATANVNTWYHVVYVWSGTTIRFYVNGVEYTATRTGLVTPQGSVLRVGGNPWGTSALWPGKIQLAQVYNRALSAAEVQQNFNAIKNRFLGESPDIPAESGYALKAARPELTSGYYWIKNSKMPNALKMYVDMSEEGGGYDFYPMQGTGASIGFVNGTHSGIALGLDLVYPRSKQHWIAMSNFVRNVLGSTGNEYFTTTYAVHRETSAGGGSRGGNYTGDIMRNPAFYGTGAPDWRVPDGGRWWLRDTTFGEPNGDYTAYNFLGGYTFPNPYTGQDLGFNDVTGQSYTTGAYYLLSTNAKP